jgi:hypothetical protein
MTGLMELATAVVGFLTALVGLITAMESRKNKNGYRSSRHRRQPGRPQSSRRPIGVVLLVAGVIIASLGVGLYVRQRGSSSPPASTPPVSPSVPPQSTFPPRSSTAYDVDADSHKGAISHQIDLGGSVDQRFPTRSSYRVEELAVIVGVDPKKTDPNALGPLRMELYEDGVLRFRDDKVKLVNNEASVVPVRDPLIMRSGSKYSFRVTNTTGKTVGYYIKHMSPRSDKNETTFQGSIDTPDGVRRGLELSGLVRIRPT